MPGLLPGLGVLLVFTIWAPEADLVDLLGLAGAAVALVTVVSVATVTRRFRPDAVLEV